MLCGVPVCAVIVTIDEAEQFTPVLAVVDMVNAHTHRYICTTKISILMLALAVFSSFDYTLSLISP